MGVWNAGEVLSPCIPDPFQEPWGGKTKGCPGGLLASPAFAEELEGSYRTEVLDVIDGDTIRARVQVWRGHNVETTVRICDIDISELRGKCPGEREAAALARIIWALVLKRGTISNSVLNASPITH